MTDKKVEVSLIGKEASLMNALGKSEKALVSFGSKTIDMFKRTNDALVKFHDKSIGLLGDLGIGVGFVVAAKNLIDFDNSLLRLGMRGNHSKQDILGLRKEILDLTQTMPLTKGQFVDMATALETTGVAMSTIKTILPQVGKGAAAAMVDTKTYSATIGELLDKYKVMESDLPMLQEQLHAAMKMDDVRKSPEAFLQSLQGLAKTMQLMKAQGMGSVTPLMALMAQLTAFTGSSGEAASSLESLFNGLLRISKNKDINNQLKARGIDFFNPSGGVKNISEVLPMIKKLGEELKKSGKSADEGAMAIFGRPEAAKAMMIIVDKYDEIMKKQEELKNSSGGMSKDYETTQESMTAKLTRFQNQIDKFNVDHMTGALKQVSSVLDFMNANPIIAKGLMVAILGAGGLIMINKVIEAVRGIGGVLKGGKGAGGILGGGGTPVFVTNMPGGGIPGISGAGGGGAMGLLGKASVIAGTAAAAYELGSWIESKFIKGGIGNWAYDVMNKNENKVKVNINIDKSGRVTTSSDDMNTEIDVERGDFYQ